jgi:hypothetical protein
MSLLLRCAIACGAAVSIAAGPAIAQRADPSEAVVFVRVFATISAEVDEFRKKVEKRGVELLTGTGVIVSPVGHVLTSYHLIDLQDRTLEHNGRKYDVSTTLERVEVVLSSGQRLDASVFGSDPENDLAVLTVSGGGELPFVPLGDSDAVERGTAVTAHGYPLGRSLDIGREQSDTDVPEATITPGAVSAIRDGEHDEAKFLQVTNALNPGNSGGPLIDEDGYAVGIVSMGARKAAGIGFAIPINRAKEFLEKVGLDSALPSRRLTLAASSSLPDKGLRLQLPQGYQDGLPGRLRVEAGDRAAGDPLLRVDRVFSRWTVAQIEQGLLAGGRVVSGPPYESEARGRRIAKGQISGRATRFDPDGRRTGVQSKRVEGVVGLNRGRAAAARRLRCATLAARPRRANRLDPGAGGAGLVREPGRAPGVRLDLPESLCRIGPVRVVGRRCADRPDAAVSRREEGRQLSDIHRHRRGQLCARRAAFSRRGRGRADRVSCPARARGCRGGLAARVAWRARAQPVSAQGAAIARILTLCSSVRLRADL